MLWKSALKPLLDAVHWTAIVFAGMLAVLFGVGTRGDGAAKRASRERRYG